MGGQEDDLIGEASEERPASVAISALIPLLILLLFASLGHNFSAPSESVDAQEVAFQNNPVPLIVRGCAYLLALGTVLAHSGASLQFFRRQITFLLLAAYIGSSMLWSAFPSKVFINWGHLMGLGLVLMSAGCYFKYRPDGFFAVVSGTLGLSLLFSIIVALLVPAVGVSELDGRWQGFAGNANSLGMIALISVWSNTAGLYMPVNRKARKWHWLGLAISFTALGGTRSVTSILTAGFTVAAIFFLIRLEDNPNLVRIMKILAAAWGLLIIFAMLLVFAPELLEAKGLFGLLGRSTTFSGRTNLWEEAWRLITMRPLLGWSFDSNMSVLNHLGNVGQFHSGYLDLLVRGGWVGMVLFIGILTSIFARIVKLARLEYRRAALFAVMTVAILLHNVTEASLVRETHLLWTLLLFFYFFAYQRKKDLREATSKARGVSNMSPEPILDLPEASGIPHFHTIN
jgi:O-antigen ligase